MDLQEVVDRIVAATPGVSWSIDVPGRASHEPGQRLRTASIGKLLLLAEVARGFETGELDPGEVLSKDPALAVADSGLWQHLAVHALPVADLAVLIAAVSDNYATNVLLARVGLPAVRRTATALGLHETQLLDFVRNNRGPHHPPTLSTGAAGELAAFMHRINRRELLTPAVSERLDGWLATSTDLSMVASAFHDDPLAHTDSVRNKTGTDDGIRADVGYRGEQAYAVLANFAPGDTSMVLHAMREIGTALS
ncbi:class A beta-lactamase-related serine hydrolase [Actinoplanes sp. TRM 88003]|uniref:Class A beta-lactamase-related serine hydrolase n=1 Tax=Paractinoplanes aksuensis TaxID=2939490 RepID=A0ABT1E0T1_9ACTN|nr:serine hydrolase [Actinoplanes aksuensis]MCO8275886.1 class A beta-lactamase-related serine hydrolase [Actinoplanes aksuensis]